MSGNGQAHDEMNRNEGAEMKKRYGRWIAALLTAALAVMPAGDVLTVTVPAEEAATERAESTVDSASESTEESAVESAADSAAQSTGESAAGSAAESTEESISAMFEEPAMACRPYARWWLAEGSHTDETLIESIRELYDAGYGGIEFVTLNESKYLDNETYAWGSDEWIHDTHVIIEECAKLGMSVSMTSGTNWSTANLISINPDLEAAAQELGYAVVTPDAQNEEGHTAYSGELPQCSLPSGVSKQTLVSVVAVKVTERGEDSAIIDLSSAQDITALVTAAGDEAGADTTADDSNGTEADNAVAGSGEASSFTIDWAAEDDGDYDLIAFWQYGTGEKNAPAVTNSYTINYLSAEGAEAVIEYWDEHVLTDEVQSLIDQIDECDMYMDSLECSVHGADTTGNFWCADMLSQFSTRCGYDLSAVLPLLIKSQGRGGSFGAPLDYAYEAADEDGEAYAQNLRRDFYQTMTELYTENCLQVLSDWLHSRHMKLRAENSYGVTFEISEPVKALDYVEAESMEFANELDMYRGQAGAAHLFGKRYSSETGAWVSSNYRYNNLYYRQIFYMQFAAGISKTVTHGYAAEYGPEGRVQWPGYEGMDDVWSERFNKRQPAAEDYPEINLHLSRLEMALEAGVPQMDLAILRTDYSYNNSVTPGGMMNFVKNGVYTNKSHTQDAYYWRDLTLQNAGYTYDYFSPYLLEDEEVSSRDGLLNADGAAYQALIVMEEELPYEAAVRMLEWAKDGLPILFVNNTEELVDNSNTPKVNGEAGSTTGSNDGNDEALAAVVAEMKSLDCVRTVDSEAEAYTALQELGVRPRTEYAESNTCILPVLRRTDEADYLYLYNYMYEETEDYDGDLSVEGEFAVYHYDTWSGSAEAVACTAEDGRTSFHVTLAPGETAVYVLQRRTAQDDAPGAEADAAAEAEEQSEDAGAADTDDAAVAVAAAGADDAADNAAAAEEIALTGWSLTVDSYEPGEMVTRTELNEDTGVETTEVAYTTNHVMIDAGTLDELVPWKDIEAVGEEVSGTGTYRTTFELTQEQPDAHAKILFEAESFCGGTAALWINGEQVPVNMDSGRADITAYVSAGENTVEVRVTSSLRNVMRKVGYDSGWIMGAPDADEYGLTGEVKVVLES